MFNIATIFAVRLHNGLLRVDAVCIIVMSHDEEKEKGFFTAGVRDDFGWIVIRVYGLRFHGRLIAVT